MVSEQEAKNLDDLVWRQVQVTNCSLTLGCGAGLPPTCKQATLWCIAARCIQPSGKGLSPFGGRVPFFLIHQFHSQLLMEVRFCPIYGGTGMRHSQL